MVCYRRAVHGRPLSGSGRVVRVLAVRHEEELVTGRDVEQRFAVWCIVDLDWGNLERALLDMSAFYLNEKSVSEYAWRIEDDHIRRASQNAIRRSFWLDEQNSSG